MVNGQKSGTYGCRAPVWADSPGRRFRRLGSPADLLKSSRSREPWVQPSSSRRDTHAHTRDPADPQPRGPAVPRAHGTGQRTRRVIPSEDPSTGRHPRGTSSSAHRVPLRLVPTSRSRKESRGGFRDVSSSLLWPAYCCSGVPTGLAFSAFAGSFWRPLSPVKGKARRGVSVLGHVGEPVSRA